VRLRETFSVSISRVVPNIKSERCNENRSFYVDLLGFEVAMDVGWLMTFELPKNPMAQVSILKRDATASVHPDLSVEVQDVDAVHAAALRRRPEIVHRLRMNRPNVFGTNRRLNCVTLRFPEIGAV